MLSLKVTTIGSSAGVILPKEALAHLKVRKGDTVYLTEAPDGSYRLTPYDPSSRDRCRWPRMSCTRIGTSCAPWRSDRLAVGRYCGGACDP